MVGGEEEGDGEAHVERDLFASEGTVAAGVWRWNNDSARLH